MKNSSKKLLGPVQVVVLALILSAVGIGGIVYASGGPSYAEPDCAPTGCNASAPINVSGSMQFKSGGLTVATGAGITTGFVVTNGKAGIGTTVPTEKLTVNGKFAFTQTGTNGADSGKIDFRGFDPSALSIVGAGTQPNRIVHIFDKLLVDTICASDGTHCISVTNIGGNNSTSTSGVGKIIAGTNITISPTTGVGDVTINATGGTGGGGSGFTCGGTCTTPHVARFYTSGTVVDSVIQASGSEVGIGITPDFNYKLKVDGSVNATAFYYTSDRTLKDNISPLQDSLNKVLQLQGVSFNWKKDGRSDVGLIAQDVEKVYPQLVSTGTDGKKTLEYANLVAPLIEAVKAQQKEIDQLKAQVQDLQNKK